MSENKYIAHIGLKGIPVKLGGGGIELFVYKISKELVKKGYNISVYVRKWYQSDIAQHNIDGIEIIQTPSYKFSIIDPVSHTITSALHALLQRKSQIIHLHGYVSYFVIPLFKLLRNKTIITLHGNILENISYTNIQKKFLHILTNIGLRFADVITTVSKEQYQTLSSIKKKVYFTPYGVDQKKPVEPDIIAKKYNLSKNTFLLFLGRIEKVKRVDWILKAHQTLKLQYKLAIAGDSSDKEYLSYCKNIAKNNNNIILTGFVEGQLKEELPSNCLLFLLPSISEGMPTALLEAMAYGKACLVTDIPSLNSIITEGQNGFLFNGTYEDFERRLNELISIREDKLAEIGEKAKLFVEERFSLTNTAEIFDEIYQELLMK